ncbi:hypothetical protein C8R46DRAFT_908335 [Mycena filopes]|nr:hypothetical protein C8R46DRAFT_908335 [Mycena filopes]
MDNATNNDTMVVAFEARCSAENILFSAVDGRMRCMPHTIHLSALKLLEAIGALTKEESKKSQSRQGVYQEASTESLSPERDNEATRMDDAPESTTTKPTSAVGQALRKIVQHVRSSPQRRQTWQKEVAAWYKDQKESGTARPLDIASENVLMLILDVKTRWSCEGKGAQEPS